MWYSAFLFCDVAAANLISSCVEKRGVACEGRIVHLHVDGVYLAWEVGKSTYM